MRNIQFANGNFYHIYNRGVNKNQIFFDETDYFRFVHDLYEFNDAQPALDFRFVQQAKKNNTPRKRELLIEILAWCLMPNHFHLMVRQKAENGISEFMRKIGTGYTLYLNKKFERSGYVFASKFKAKHIDNESYLLHISRYIHLNPVDLIEPNWRKGGIGNWGIVSNFLKEYRWSSYIDWRNLLSTEVGLPEIRNFPSLINTSFATEMFKDVQDYDKFMQEWASNDLNKLEPFMLD